MKEFTFEELMRTGHVKRWQIVRVAREQTLAEHLYRVWVITSFLCQVMGLPDEPAQVAAQWALLHDTPEVITGDIATPTKRAMREAVPDSDPIHNIELSMSDTYRDCWKRAKTPYPGYPTPYEIVKLADIMEAKCFLGMEQIGEHAARVYDGICGGLDRRVAEMLMKYPDLPWSRIFVVINKSWTRV